MIAFRKINNGNALLNLSELAIKNFFPEQNQRLPKADNKFDAGYAQISFIPGKPFKVIYTKDDKPVETYGELPDLGLDETAREVVEKYKKERSTNPNFHDGDLILIKKINYDPSKNVLYLEAVKAKYSAMSCIQNKLFDKSSYLATTALWRHGVISPYLTKDNFTCVMERSADKFYSATAGFIQPSEGETSQINFPLDEADLITRQGIQESNEEFLWDNDKKPRLDIDNTENILISMRRMGENMPVLELVTPIKLKCTALELETVLANNIAPDRKEHTNNHVMLSLNPIDLVKEYSTNLKSKSGVFLYEPIVQATTVAANPDKASELISGMSFSGKVVNMQNLISVAVSSGLSEASMSF